MGVISTDSNGCQLLYGQYMPPYFFVILSAVLSLLYEALMMKYAIPATKTYLLPMAQQHLRSLNDMFFKSTKNETSDPSKNVDNPIVHHVSGRDLENLSGEVRSSNDMAVIIDGKKLAATTIHHHVDIEISAIKDDNSGNSKEDNAKLFKHVYTDLQLLTAYAIIIFVLATTSMGNTSFSKFYAYQSIMGKFYFSMVLTACVALMLDPAVDASLNFSEPIAKGKILHRYRSRDGIISLYVYLTICCCNTGPMYFIQKLDDPAVLSEYEKAELSTFEQLLCCCSSSSSSTTGAPVLAEGVTNTVRAAEDDFDNIEYKWLEIIYCFDQCMRWFYVPYILRLLVIIDLMLLRLVLCKIFVELGLRLSRFTYVAVRHHAENKFITKQILFILPLLTGFLTNVIVGWLAYPYIFLLLFAVCFDIKVLLDKMVEFTVGDVVVSPHEAGGGGALDTRKILQHGSIPEQVRYLALKCLWRTFLLLSTQVGFNYATLLYVGQPYIDVIGNELALRGSDCFFENFQENAIVFFSWI